MKEDLKEMLHCIEMNCKHNKCFGGIKLDEEDCKLLLDYITNLQDDYQEQYTYEYNLRKQFQQENKRLKEKIEEQSLLLIEFQDMEERLDIYKSRFKKAKDIKSIVTKEQFESMQYNLESEVN